MTWTLFDADGTSYIFGAYSRDYGEHFSSPKLISGDSALCSNTARRPDAAGPLQHEPVLAAVHGPGRDAVRGVGQLQRHRRGPGEGGEGDGDFGTDAAPQAVDNRQQVLLAKSTDGGNSFSAPVKVADFYDLPDCVTYQGDDAGVSCVPEKGETTNSIFRAANYPSGAVDPTNRRKVVVTLGSYINRHSNEGNGCVPQGINPATLRPLYDGVKTAGACNNDIVISRSTNAGAIVHRWLDRRARATGHAGGRPRERRPVLAVGGVRSARAPGGLLLRPRLWRRRDHRVLGHQPVGLAQRQRLRHDARDVVVHAPAHPVLGPRSTATTVV